MICNDKFKEMTEPITEYRWTINESLRRQLEYAYREARKHPTECNSLDVTSTLVDIFKSISLFLESKYFTVYKQMASSSSNDVTNHLHLSSAPVVAPTIARKNICQRNQKNQRVSDVLILNVNTPFLYLKSPICIFLGPSI